MCVHPEGRGFGARITGIDLTQPLKEAEVTALRNAWLDHQVVCVAEQKLTPAELAHVARYFGDPCSEPFVQPIAQNPQVVEVRREPDETAIPFGSSWHSDWSFLPRPPSATLLAAKTLPPYGGDTLFADACRAWTTLPSALKNRLQGILALHSARRAYTPESYRAAGGDERSMHIEPSDQAWAVQKHPVVRIHPETGREVLWINPVYTIGLSDTPKEEADAILRCAYEHLLDKDHLYRHRWRANDLVIWDNRSVLHCAQGGYDGHLRIMHRATVAGEQPV